MPCKLNVHPHMPNENIAILSAVSAVCVSCQQSLICCSLSSISVACVSRGISLSTCSQRSLWSGTLAGLCPGSYCRCVQSSHILCLLSHYCQWHVGSTVQHAVVFFSMSQFLLCRLRKTVTFNHHLVSVSLDSACFLAFSLSTLFMLCSWAFSEVQKGSSYLLTGRACAQLSQSCVTFFVW